MSTKSNILKLFLGVSFVLGVGSPVLAVQNGGYWSYGGHHDPDNWGAFSSYRHDYMWHWASVTRASDSRGDYKTADRHYTAYAFVNTSFGEHAWFDCGTN
ncbi:lactococcin 972 family bacteriocin [Streptococcus ovuberis]|uniref:lactococcin 972 family bacteriocin n=1 Tax=Streptococcus ovuberis TaxID=1936207 RepID=UPI001FE416CE|nr:lactococcin 972 family bacteriocin [Streptococcus ovuberis]